jgi:catechol 2,3-dioxygenase-like lactoylglutathione lyase family enzyme
MFGAHVIMYSQDAVADRAFFRDVLGLAFVDGGHDWLIFALPPAELAVHPAESSRHELFLCATSWTPRSRRSAIGAFAALRSRRQAGAG